MTKGAIKRLARRGGVRRISGLSKLLSRIPMPSESILMLTPLSRFYSLRRDERSAEDLPYVQRPLNRGVRISSDIEPFDSRFVTVENVIRGALPKIEPGT